MNIDSRRNVRTCYDCKGTAEGRQENYVYSECGLRNIVLKDVMTYRCSRCGATHVEIPNMDGLHRTIAISVLRKRSQLCSEEIRFLRKTARYSATEFANGLGVTKNVVSRWENGRKAGRQSDRSIRIFCGLAIIREILLSKSGAVEMESVSETLDRIRQFLSNLDLKELATENAADTDSDKILIDPSVPYTASLLQPLGSETLRLIQ